MMEGSLRKNDLYMKYIMRKNKVMDMRFSLHLLETIDQHSLQNVSFCLALNIEIHIGSKEYEDDIFLA